MSVISGVSTIELLLLKEELELVEAELEEDSKYRFLDFFSTKLKFSLLIRCVLALAGNGIVARFSMLVLDDSFVDDDDVEGVLESEYVSNSKACDGAAAAAKTLVRNTRTASFEPKVPPVTQWFDCIC